MSLFDTDSILLVVGENIEEGAAREGKDRGGGYGGPQGEAVRSIYIGTCACVYKYMTL
jgi:hypothetical protein